MKPKGLQSSTGAYLYARAEFFEVKTPILCDGCYDERRGKEGPQTHRLVYSPKISKGVCESCSRTVWQRRRPSRLAGRPNVGKIGAKRKTAKANRA